MTAINPHTTRATGTILTAAIYNFDHNNHIANATALNAGKIEAAAAPTVVGHAAVFGDTAGTVLMDGGNAPTQLGIGVRINLIANRTYFVRSDGNDANTGLVDSAGGAFLTVQKAADVVYGTLDLRGFDVDIQVRDGTFGRALIISPQVGKGNITLKGNAGTPANVVLTATAIGEPAGVVEVRNFAVLFVQGLSITTVTSGSCLQARDGGVIYFSNIRFGAAVHYHMHAASNSLIKAIGNYAITAGAAVHIRSGSLSEIRFDPSLTVTITGTPAFSNAFVECYIGGMATIGGTTWSGAATGKRFIVTDNSVLFGTASLTELPGDVAGTASSGGVYGGVEGWTPGIKLTDQTNATTTLAAITGISVPMAASTKYLIRGELFYDTPTAADMKIGFSGPASPTLVNIAIKGLSPDTDVTGVTLEAYDATGTQFLGAAGTFGCVRFSAVITNGVNAGDFNTTFAQVAASGTSTMRAGSYVESRVIG
jgi:hypothetical protein